MDPVRLPPEIEAQVQAFADAEHTPDLGAATIELIKRGLASAQKEAFDRQLRSSYEAGLRGEVISEEESLARIEAIERGEGGGAALRERFESGRAAFARGEAVETTPDDFMDSIDAELGLS